MGNLSPLSPRTSPPSRIAVVGGGPGGSFFALNALALARRLQITLDITIFERKDLTALGPLGCNMCAGILSRRVVRGLELIGITLPPEVVLGRISHYDLHWRDFSFAIEPPDPARQVLSVYRAGGPRKSQFPPAAGLDEFLLRKACEWGAHLVHERVTEVSFSPQPRVHSPTVDENYDLVVLATGINASPPIFSGVGYRQPSTETMAQDALLITTEHSRVQMDSTIHIYFDQPRNLIFGALVPKREFVTVSLLGQRLDKDSLQEMIALPAVQQVMGDQPPQMCGCRPRVAVGMAENFYGDHFVAVGDACVTRLYKDGIGSAFHTARGAAITALNHGVSQAAFRTHYAPLCRSIAEDNRFGRLVFALVAHSKRNSLFMRAVARSLEHEAREAVGRRVISQTLWSLFTGDADYREIATMLLHPRTASSLVRATLQLVARAHPNPA